MNVLLRSPSQHGGIRLDGASYEAEQYCLQDYKADDGKVMWQLNVCNYFEGLERISHFLCEFN